METVEINRLESAIEAILFTMGDSVELGKIASAIEHDEETTRKIVHQMMDKYLLETLSIIAYKQPVTKLEVEKIRGVKSDHAVNKLVEYNLACEVGRLDAPGKPILFGTTEEFLRRFSIQSVDDLPVLNPEQVEHFKSEAEEEVQLKLDV